MATLTAEAILRDPSASYWLKNALRAALDRDAVDAANDADVLARILHNRVQGAADTFHMQAS